MTVHAGACRSTLAVESPTPETIERAFEMVYRWWIPSSLGSLFVEDARVVCEVAQSLETALLSDVFVEGHERLTGRDVSWIYERALSLVTVVRF